VSPGREEHSELVPGTHKVTPARLASCSHQVSSPSFGPDAPVSLHPDPAFFCLPDRADVRKVEHEALRGEVHPGVGFGEGGGAMGHVCSGEAA